MTVLHGACAFQEKPGKFELLIPSARHSLVELPGDELGKEEESWRRKHSDGIDCACWAFSSDGLPKLQILVFGGFSHKIRYTSQDLLLYRNERVKNI